MRLTNSRMSAFGLALLEVVVLFACILCAVSQRAEAQCVPPTTQGFNTVYGIFCGGTATQAAFTMVDASQFTGDICAAIATSFSTYASSVGVVVDARGFNSVSPQPCMGNPWSGTAPLQTVVLLPSGTINMYTTWTLPADTRLIGEGINSTILQACLSSACGSNFMGSAMLQMGCSTNDCPAISIEHLGLNGNGLTSLTSGVFNQYSQELSHLDDVAFANIPGVALNIMGAPMGSGAENTGPHTKLTMTNVGTCVKIAAFGGGITPLANTRGIHGLSCTLSSSSSGAAIYVDAPNNSLEDISITGNGTTSQDGILIGSMAFAVGNVLFNIQGSGLTTSVVHISNQVTTGAPYCPPTGGSSSYNVCDLTILGVTSAGGTPSIKDELTNTTLTDPHVGVYILGEPVQAGSTSTNVGYSLFTTSTSAGVPTWLVGPGKPASSSSCSIGELYSRTGSLGMTTLFACRGGGGGWNDID
jgi:hypothetical protein